MPNQEEEQKRVNGLALQSNSFVVPEGSYERLNNCVVIKDNIIQKKRGEATFYAIGGARTGRNQLSYQDKLVGITDSTVQVYNQNASGEFSSVTTLGGSAFTVASGTKGRTVESNGNKYFTADDGVYKLESATANVLKSGIDAATDLQIFQQTKSAIETFFRPNSQVSYRILFGRKDANNNIVIGAPSQIVSATNPVITKTATLAGTTVTVTSVAHGLTSLDVIYVVNAQDTGIPDGNYTITVTGVDTFTFPANTGTGGALPLSYGTFKTTTLDFSIPSGITTEYFARIYRSTVSAASSVLADESTLQLVDEFNITSAQVSTGFIIYTDSTPEILRSTFLYTNPNTGEPRGIAEANEKPPQCKDMALFKGAVWYANIQANYFLTLNVITSNATTFPDASELKTVSGATTRNYVGMLDPKVGNRTLRATSVAFVLTAVTVTQNGHGFNNGDIVAVAEALDSSNAQLATLPQGLYTVSGVAANTFVITAPATPTGLVAISIAGVSTAAGKRMFYIENSNTTTVASALADTARSIVRAMNRDPSASVYAYYISSPTGIPGQMVLRSKGVSTTFNVNAVTSTIVTSFNPQIPTTGATVVGTRDDGQGLLYFSKPFEPEAVPLANKLPIGSQSSAILRIAPLRDSLIVLKEDGAFRVNGTNYSNFTVTILDSTVNLKASDSVAVLDNKVYGLTNQGVTAVSETTAQIVSRAIEPAFTSILGNTLLETMTHAVGYESERLYILTTIDPTATTATRVYVYNHLTNAWSTWNSSTFLDAIINPVDDRLYFIDLHNTIYRERKNQNFLDYCGLSYSATALTVPTSMTATLSITGPDAEVDDVVVYNNIISRITAVSGNGINRVYTFASVLPFIAAASVTVYKGIISEIRNSPHYGGLITNLKQFSELQVDFRNRGSCSRADVYFVSDSALSDITPWSSNVTSPGWGFEPWGFFEWGEEDDINIPLETTSNQPMRMYVPLETQRGTYIQANITHGVAAQNINLQALTFTTRMYKQRTTK